MNTIPTFPDESKPRKKRKARKHIPRSQMTAQAKRTRNKARHRSMKRRKAEAEAAQP